MNNSMYAILDLLHIKHKTIKKQSKLKSLDCFLQ